MTIYTSGNNLAASARKAALVCLIALSTALLSACSPSAGSKYTEAAVKQAEEDFDSMFSRVEKVYSRNYMARTPDEVLSGAHSKIITRSKVVPGTFRRGETIFENNNNTFVGARGLGKTNKGEWFSFVFQCDVDYDYTPCTEKNFFIERIHVEDAKTWLWKDRELFSVELYRDTFGEEPPPRRTLT